MMYFIIHMRSLRIAENAGKNVFEYEIDKTELTSVIRQMDLTDRYRTHLLYAKCSYVTTQRGLKTLMRQRKKKIISLNFYLFFFLFTEVERKLSQIMSNSKINYSRIRL